MMSGGADGGVEALVAQVKELQRTDAHAKAQWGAYTDQNGGGKRDPSKHDAAFLQGFLLQLNSGVTLQGATIETHTVLGEAIKVMQKKSSVFKELWGSYCAQHGGGKMDPAKHDEKFHAKFFEQVAQAASGRGPAAGPSPAMGMGCGGPPQKRMREMGGMGAGMGMPGGGGGPKEQAVARVKAFQRMGEEQKGLWATYVDTYFSGVRDPSKHEAGMLLEFCTNHGVPEVSNAGSGAGPQMTPPMGCGKGGGMPGLGGPMGCAAAVGNDAEKMGLVDRVKAYQKMGPENKEHWSQFCGGTRDPARHDKEKLQEFCMSYGVPEVSNSGFGAGPQMTAPMGCGMGGGMPGGMGGGMPGFGGPVGGAAATGNDAEKMGLVERVKAYQKMSPDNKENWSQFAGATKDPARHDQDKLQEFCMQAGI